MSIYERHCFVCTSGDWCGTIDGDGLGVHARLKALVKERGLGDRVRDQPRGLLLASAATDRWWSSTPMTSGTPR